MNAWHKLEHNTIEMVLWLHNWNHNPAHQNANLTQQNTNSPKYHKIKLNILGLPQAFNEKLLCTKGKSLKSRKWAAESLLLLPTWGSGAPCGRLNKTNTALLAQPSCSQNIRQQTCAQFHWRGKHDSTLYSTVLGKPNKCTFYAAVDWSLIYLPGKFIFVTHDNDRVTRKHWLISLGFGCKWTVSITDKIKCKVCFKFTLFLWT